MRKVSAYISDDLRGSFDRLNRPYKSDRENSAEILTDAIIQPVVHHAKIQGFKRTDVGVFRKDRTYVMGSNMWMAHEEMTAQLPEYMPVADAKFVWGGELLNHYGHFLTQSTARIYYYLQNRDKFDGILFVWLWNFGLPQYMLDFFQLAGIPLDEVKITNQVLKVRELAVPTLSCYNCWDWTDDFLLPFKNAAEKVPAGRDKKIYLSRSAWEDHKAYVIGEKEVERAFNKNGFKSICPEKLSLAGQIAAIKGADEIAGISGTALHNILFAAGTTEKKRVIALNRTEIMNIQPMLDEAAGADSTTIEAYHNFIRVAHSDGPFIIGMTKHLREFFKDNNMDDCGIKFRPERHAREFLRRYLYMYSTTEHYYDLINQKGNQIEAADLMNLSQLANWPKTRRAFWKIVSIVAPKKSQRIYARFKSAVLNNVISLAEKAGGGY
ncbi:MAG: glycosyltransferase family 61 protein [Rickettsiales bacterium]|nr:glycosyltransferase family 61 protein [Rickettsiales bacterium]